MKYDFHKHVGIENLTNENKLFDLMVDVLFYTKAKVNLHALKKKERYFLCPMWLLETDANGKLKTCIISCYSREEKELRLSKSKMVQVIKKALKNYTRAKADKIEN
jgi:hypothetical protein